MSSCSYDVCLCLKSNWSLLSWLLVARVYIVWVSASCYRLTVMSLEVYFTKRNSALGLEMYRIKRNSAVGLEMYRIKRNSAMGLEMYRIKRNSVSPHIVAIYMDTRLSVFWAWKRRVIDLGCADLTINSDRLHSTPTSTLTVFQQPYDRKLVNSGYYYCCTCDSPGWHFLSSVYLLHVLYIISARQMEWMLKRVIIHSSYPLKRNLTFSCLGSNAAIQISG
jgi:hypothetical protein